MPTTLLVLAAGLGSRYGGLKQLDPVGPDGETVLDYALFDAARAGFGKAVFVIREEFAEAFHAAFGHAFADSLEITPVYQDPADLPPPFKVLPGRRKPWGTAHAVRAARDAIDTPFAVINADDFYGRRAFRTLAGELTAPEMSDAASAHLVGYRLANTLSPNGPVNRGVCRAEDGRLRTVEEHTGIEREGDGIIRGTPPDGERVELAPDTPVSMNLWGLRPSFFPLLEERFQSFLEANGNEPDTECYLPSVINELMREDRLRCRLLETDETWCGMTYPEDKPAVKAEVRRRVEDGCYPAPLRTGGGRGVESS